jgi:hypothetical protein
VEKLVGMLEIILFDLSLKGVHHLEGAIFSMAKICRWQYHPATPEMHDLLGQQLKGTIYGMCLSLSAVLSVI